MKAIRYSAFLIAAGACAVAAAAFQTNTLDLVADVRGTELYAIAAPDVPGRFFDAGRTAAAAPSEPASDILASVTRRDGTRAKAALLQ